MGQNEKGTRLTEPWVESFLENPWETWRDEGIWGFIFLGCMALGEGERVAKIGETTPFMIHSDLYTHFSVVFY